MFLSMITCRWVEVELGRVEEVASKLPSQSTPGRLPAACKLPLGNGLKMNLIYK